MFKRNAEKYRDVLKHSGQRYVLLEVQTKDIHTYIHTHIHIYTRTIAIFTDSRITIDSLKNVNNHSYLIEEFRKRISILERTNWTVEFSWVKAHVGIYRNELVDQLAKAAACNRHYGLLQQDSKEYVIQRNSRRSYTKMARSMGKL
jgi:hypothetical protein